MPLCWTCYDQHDELECNALNELNLPKSLLIEHFDVITPLRVLLLLWQHHKKNGINSIADHTDVKLDNKNSSWDHIDEMLRLESHCSLRQHTMIWNTHEINVVQPLRDIADIFTKFSEQNIPWQIDDKFIQKICGIFDVNSFEVRTPNFEVSTRCK